MTYKDHLFHKKRLPSAYNLLLCSSMFIGMGTLHASTSGLFFREGTCDTPPALPISQDHVANPQLQIKLHGAARKQLKKSYHENKKLDPHYLWSGRCEDRWAVTWRQSDATANLSGSEARVRLRTSNSRRTLYIILRTDDGWLISDQGAEPSGRNWKRTTLKFEGLTWNRMKPSLVRGEEVSWKVHDVKILHPDQSSVALQAQVDWLSPNWKDGKRPFMVESVRIHVHPADGQQQKVDFSIELLARTNNVKIGGADNEKGYGGFSLRFLMPGDIKFKSKNGTVEAKRTAVDQSPWMNFSGSFGGDRSNITVLIHPETAGFPQPWILRRRGSMQNPVFPGREPVTVPTDKALTLKYRIVLHESGNPSTLFEQYQD